MYNRKKCVVEVHPLFVKIFFVPLEPNFESFYEYYEEAVYGLPIVTFFHAFPQATYDMFTVQQV